MLESIFIVMLCLGFVMFLIALLEQWENLMSFICCFTSILFFLIAWAGSTYIVVPSDTYYIELGIGALCFGLIIVNVIGAIISVMNVNVMHQKGKYVR